MTEIGTGEGTINFTINRELLAKVRPKVVQGDNTDINAKEHFYKLHLKLGSLSAYQFRIPTVVTWI